MKIKTSIKAGSGSVTQKGREKAASGLASGKRTH
jgi:hypothetical protein